ncbi:hypothetical protein [Paenibacillus sp. JNUCC31]|uniref:hypothetical protein n=1 Tax=Paenibacillus sp. JNUCC-31 TaxID=2777983 RepID=UPI001E4F80AC|nr:hypothetical protein [Paenibacillus sp. JNUCC-31]
MEDADEVGVFLKKSSKASEVYPQNKIKKARIDPRFFFTLYMKSYKNYSKKSSKDRTGFTSMGCLDAARHAYAPTYTIKHKKINDSMLSAPFSSFHIS